MSTAKALSNRQVARAALVVIFGFLTSGVLGFVRVLIVSRQFGTSAALDAFLAAQQIPELIFVLVAGGALGSSFIPIYARLRETDQDEAWRLASAVMTLAALAALALGALVIVLAPWLVGNLLLRDKPPEAQALTVDLMRLMMVTPFIFSISGLVMGILQSHGLFLLPSLAISMNNIGLILGALLIAPVLPPASGVAQVGGANVYGLAYGAILSAILHLLVQLPGLWQIRARLRPLPDPRLPGVLRVLALMGPRVLGLGVVQVNFLVNIALTAPMVDGSYTALRTAFTLMFFVLGVIAQSVGSAVFPTLAALSAAGDMAGFKDRLAAALRGVLFLSFPAMVGLVVLRGPLVGLFQGGEWTATSTAAAAWALGFYAVGIAGFSLLEVLSRAFYALADTWTPVKIGVAAMLSNIVLSLILVRLIGNPASMENGPFAGLALANALTTLLEAAALWWLLRRRIGDIHEAATLNGAARALLAALGMGAALVSMMAVIGDTSPLALIVIGGVVGVLVFLGLSLLVGVPEARSVPLRLLRRARGRWFL
ncbi:MAG: murein biosynthesis integral membrane protein MurJ [Chloroflexi bacterium]|nr:murein biosynthesis integral membrane protein MurJ [Chloroflexota bacterium]